MSGQAQLRHVFGFRTNITGSLAFHDDQVIVFPCGANLVLYNIEQKVQRFLAGFEKSKKMSAIAISPNRRYLALAEKTSDRPLITMYDLNTLKKKKTLISSDVHSSEYVSLAFSPDSKYLATQGGSPDWNLVYWSWEKATQLAFVKTSTSNPINQISINPNDCTLLCVTGTDIFRLYRYGDNVIKPYGVNKIESHNFLCHTWITNEKIVAGTESGLWMIIENSEKKWEFNINNFDFLNICLRGNQSGEKFSYSVTSLVSTSKGLAVAYLSGVVCWFELAEHAGLHNAQVQNDEGGVLTKPRLTFDKDFYKLNTIIKLPNDSSNNTDGDLTEFQKITHMAVSPSEEILIACTNDHQLYQFNLNNLHLTSKNAEDQTILKSDSNSTQKQLLEPATFELVSELFHKGHISDLDICARKPLIATCATDQSVKIWNFEKNILELSKTFAEESYSIALHPSGFYIAVGFSDKLRFMNLLIDDIRTFYEIPIRGCRECTFSNGGHLLAAVNGNVIQIFSTVNFENITNLKGHNGKIRSLVWSTDDHKLVSCGLDGAVYEWDVFKGVRIGENVLKTCSYTSLSVSVDSKTVYAVGSDKSLKEICDSQITKEIDSPDKLLTAVALSRSGRMLFCGTQNGSLRSYTMPLTDSSDWQDYVAHCGPITKAKLTLGDEYLITVSDDSSVMVWRVQERDGRVGTGEKEFNWSNEILITKSDLEEKNIVMFELKTRVDELKVENEYQLRLKDMNYNERIKELTEKFIQEMETLKTKNQLLKSEKEKEINYHQSQFQEMIDKHTQELQNFEATCNQKLIIEYEKYQELQNKSQKKEEDYENQLKAMDEAREVVLKEMTEFYENKLTDKTNQIDNLNREIKEQTTEYEVTKRLVEEDADREILETKIRYEKRLKEQREMNARLKGESGIMKKKFASLMKEIDDQKEQLKKLQTETQKLNNVIKNQEKDIQNLKKEVQERDETIQDKEKRIYDLKKKNQELEKFKYVLDYKIKELKQQIEPRENDIKNYKDQVQEMEIELERFHKQNDLLEINITELKQKSKSIEQELMRERQSARDVNTMVRRLKTDVFNCVGFIQDPKKLKAADATVDSDIQKEFGRQREHLEHSIGGLRNKLIKDNELHRADYIRIMQENVSLIYEINNLRTEIKLGRTRIGELEVALGLNRKNGDVAKQLLVQIAKTRPNAIMESDFEQANRALHAQQELIETLQRKLDTYEEQHQQQHTSTNQNNLLKDMHQTVQSLYGSTKSVSELSVSEGLPSIDPKYG